LRTICGWKLASRSRGTSSSTGPTSVSTVLARVPPGGVAAVAADRVAVLVAKVVGELALKRALHHQLRHALQQPVWADQTDALCPGLGDQLRGELLVHGIRPCAGRALGCGVWVVVSVMWCLLRCAIGTLCHGVTPLYLQSLAGAASSSAGEQVQTCNLG